MLTHGAEDIRVGTSLAVLEGRMLEWLAIPSDAEAEAPILGPRDVKGSLTGKDPDAEKD